MTQCNIPNSQHSCCLELKEIKKKVEEAIYRFMKDWLLNYGGVMQKEEKIVEIISMAPSFLNSIFLIKRYSGTICKLVNMNIKEETWVIGINLASLKI